MFTWSVTRMIAASAAGALSLAAGVAIVSQADRHLPGAAHAAGGVVENRTGTPPDSYVYYPGTEELALGEVRVIAYGTEMPDSIAMKGQERAYTSPIWYTP